MKNWEHPGVKKTIFLDRLRWRIQRLSSQQVISYFINLAKNIKDAIFIWTVKQVSVKVSRMRVATSYDTESVARKSYSIQGLCQPWDRKCSKARITAETSTEKMSDSLRTNQKHLRNNHNGPKNPSS